MNHFVNLAETVITTKFGILVASGDLFCICHISILDYPLFDVKLQRPFPPLGIIIFVCLGDQRLSSNNTVCPIVELNHTGIRISRLYAIKKRRLWRLFQ